MLVVQKQTWSRVSEKDFETTCCKTNSRKGPLPVKTRPVTSKQCLSVIYEASFTGQRQADTKRNTSCYADFRVLSAMMKV